MQITVGIQHSQIETDNPQVLKALDNIYAKKIKGAEYTPSYRRRGWDGKKHFVTPAGKFRSGLLPFILSSLGKVNCYPTLINNYQKSNIAYDFDAFEKARGFNPYPFQKELVNLALEANRGIIKSPTGSGKTLIMAMLIDALRKKHEKMVILFNAKQLLTQTYDFLTKELRFKDIGICFGEGFIYGDIMLCTIQSIEKILDSHLEESTVLMVDEVHLFANGKTTLAAIESFPNASIRFGFTATLPDDEVSKFNLYANFGPVIEAVTTQKLIEKGHLTKPEITMLKYVPTEEDLANSEDESFFTIYEEYIVSNPKRNKIILDLLQKIANENPQAKVVVLTKNLSHTDYIHKHCNNSLKLEGEDDIQTRYKVIREFRKDGFKCLVGTKILETGVNIEEITHIVLARGLKSESSVIQALGRGLRTHKSKDVLYFYDIYDSGFDYLEKHSKARKKAYEAQGHKVKLV